MCELTEMADAPSLRAVAAGMLAYGTVIGC